MSDPVLDRVDRLEKAETERDRLRKALVWYEVRVGALDGRDNGPGEHAYILALGELQSDSGKRARKALEDKP